jgi:hypothetical protein
MPLFRFPSPAELTPVFAETTTELSPQNPDSFYPPDKSPPEEGSERARATSTLAEIILSEGIVILPAEHAAPVPVETRPPEPPPAVDADPARPESQVLVNGSVDTGREDTPRAHPLPDDWTAAAEDLTFARSRGLDPEEMTLAFCAHYGSLDQADPRNWRANWSKAFRSWCIREVKFYPPGKVNRADREEELRRGTSDMLAQLAARGCTSLDSWGARS